MAKQVFKKHLIHQCTIERRTDSQSASGELIPAWTDTNTINCRYVQKRERYADESLGFMMLEQHILLVNDDADVVEEDRITDIVRRRDGITVDAGPFTIESVLDRSTYRPHHISLELERVE